MPQSATYNQNPLLASKYVNMNRWMYVCIDSKHLYILRHTYKHPKNTLMFMCISNAHVLLQKKNFEFMFMFTSKSNALPTRANEAERCSYMMYMCMGLYTQQVYMTSLHTTQSDDAL